MTDPIIYDKKMKEFDNEVGKHDPNLETVTEFDSTDGKVRSDDKTLNELKALEKLLGIAESNPFGTLNRAIFEEKISDMNVLDMQSLAMRVGVPPSRDRVTLKRSLKSAFDSFVKRHDVGASLPAQPVVTPDSPHYQSIVKLFKE